MNDKKSAISYFKHLKGKKRNINTVEFNTCVNELMSHRDSGFSEGEIETLIDALINIEYLASVKFQQLLSCCVPRTKVSSKAVLGILHWIFTYFHSKPFGSVTKALDWIIGLVEFRLTDEKTVHAFYQHFFMLLRIDKLAVFACKLIHLLTSPADILRWRVCLVLKAEQMFGKTRHTSALLCLFKSYKPECVPENTVAINLQLAFRSVGKMNSVFEKVQSRLNATHDERTHTENIVWDCAQGLKRTTKRKKLGAIPPIDYVHFGSELYREKKKKLVSEFKTMESLCLHQLNLDMPCNAMSLLQNTAGIHIITFEGRSLQIRLSYNMYHTLYAAFLEQNSDYSYEEKQNLLERIVALEEYMQQGIPVVSRFLAEYMHRWDGDDFRDMIFRLLPWITFMTFSELKDLILDNIRTLFVTSSVEVKSSIIVMLSRFVQNLICVILNRRREELPNLFLDYSDSIECSTTETLQNIIQFISDLCSCGLTLEQGNYILFHESLKFFEMISFLEEKYKLPMWSMMPPAVVYNGLFSTNAVFMSRVCKLLYRYLNVTYVALRKMGLRKKFSQEVHRLDLYITDFINCLQKSKCFEKKEDGYIFEDMPDKHIEDLSLYTTANRALELKNHFALLPYMSCVGSDPVLHYEAFDEEDVMLLIHTFFPDIIQLITCEHL
ncbi:centromere protein I-like isoform X2 [Periplaneta americana]